MNWSFTECRFGDIVRIALGTIFHYGIYVSDDEVIQFGYPPVLRDKDKGNIVVVSTDIDTFCCGQMVQVGEFTHSDHMRRFAPEVVVNNARKRIGEGGYNIIHNNCEHFAFECYAGIKYSSQEEEARKKWKSTSYLNIYLAPIPNDDFVGTLSFKERNEEISRVNCLEVKKQKYWVWKLLELAILRDLKMLPEDVGFKKEKSGKWTADKFYFSLSHTNDMVCVAISDKPVGADIENIDRLSKHDSLEKLKVKVLHKKEEVNSDKELLELWTKKESIYKCDGKSSFVPNKILASEYPVVSFEIDDEYALSACGKEIDRIRFYGLFSGKIGLFMGKVNRLS